MSELPFMTVAEAAEELGVAPDTVRRMIRKGELRAIRIGERLLAVDRESVAKAFRSRIKTATGTPVTDRDIERVRAFIRERHRLFKERQRAKES